MNKKPYLDRFLHGDDNALTEGMDAVRDAMRRHEATHSSIRLDGGEA